MGSFNDLPKDVKWLIFQQIIHEWCNVHFNHGELDYDSPFTLVPWQKDHLLFQMQILACLNKQCLRVVQAKTRRKDRSRFYVIMDENFKK